MKRGIYSTVFSDYSWRILSAVVQVFSIIRIKDVCIRILAVGYAPEDIYFTDAGPKKTSWLVVFRQKNLRQRQRLFFFHGNAEN